MNDRCEFYARPPHGCADHGSLYTPALCGKAAQSLQDQLTQVRAENCPRCDKAWVIHDCPNAEGAEPVLLAGFPAFTLDKHFEERLARAEAAEKREKALRDAAQELLRAIANTDAERHTAHKEVTNLRRILERGEQK